MIEPRKFREFRTYIIPVQSDKIELVKRRRELAIIRYDLMQKMGMRWKGHEPDEESSTREAGNELQ